jgi:hypothetical protein
MNQAVERADREHATGLAPQFADALAQLLPHDLTPLMRSASGTPPTTGAPAPAGPQTRSPAMHDPRHLDACRRVWLALVLVLAANYLALGLASGGQARLLGIAGGVLIVAACIAATASTPRLAVALAVLGATPLAVSTWWSILTPLLATVTIATTLAATHRMQHREPGRNRATVSAI